jgi:hypothetical protein
MSQLTFAQGPMSSPSYNIPHGVEYYNGGGGYTQQIAGAYSTSYPVAQQNMVQTEMIPVQMQQMQTVMVQEPVVEMVPVQQMQQVIEMVPVQVYSPPAQAPTPTRSPPLKERRPEPREPERAVHEYERERASPEPEPEEPEIIERFIIREKVKTVCRLFRCIRDSRLTVGCL